MNKKILCTNKATSHPNMFKLKMSLLRKEEKHKQKEYEQKILKLKKIKRKNKKLKEKNQMN